MNRQTVPLQPTVGHTLGGLPVDGHGRCVVGAWSRWFTGLYAAGSAACTGFHGAAPLSGNRLLDAICSGAAAGNQAGEWASGRKFSASSGLETALAEAEGDVSAMMETGDESHVVRCGTIMANLQAALAATSSLSADSMNKLQAKLEQISISAESLYVDQKSLIANTNLLEILRAQAAVRMVTASVQSGLAREESRGAFQRADFPEPNDDFLHHITVDREGTVGSLAIKKGAGGHWVLPPQ